MRYRLEQTRHFKKSFEKLPSVIQERFRKQLRRVIERPYECGKPLGYSFFRELKQGVFRAYYIVDEKTVIVLLVNTSDKDTQREIIDAIKTHLKDYFP